MLTHGVLYRISYARLLENYLGHGDIVAKSNVQSFLGDRVQFADGSEEQIDLVVAATGYKRVFPFFKQDVAEAKQKGKEIDLHLEIFSRTYDNLFFVGGIEVSSAIFGLLILQGELIAAYLKAQAKGGLSYQQFLRKKDQPLNLRGNNKYIDTLRHQRYVDKKLYRKLLNRQIHALQS